ncbi:FHA domain-containing protein [Spirillospora albida]|uniref:FHA domain-containing protein n=1 Tax=Spirillospora albida TaxID=58123 RepID=UPI0004C142C8|nr:FHA domain-containing protein [Spirillospora albida]
MTGPDGAPGRLTVSAAGRERRFAPGDRVLIGRGAGCDLVLADARVSRRHLEITFDGGWVLRDLDSANGTWHEDTAVTARPAGAGLAVRLGDRLDGVLVEIIVTPPEDGAEAPVREPVPLGRRLTIGRGRGNGLVLDDPLVSREHARIVRGARGHVVQDLGSANLTFRNGDRVTRAPLCDGDVLTIGRTRLVRIADRLHFLPGDPDTGLELDELAVLPGSGGAPLTLSLTGGSLLAIVGPSGSGKSLLLRQIAGRLPPAAGRIRYESRDVHANADIRTRIALVPDRHTGHRRLTVRQAAGTTAALRRPADTAPAELAEAVRDALAETGLTEAAGRRAGSLDAERRRRLRIACELLTGPSLLLVDEPFAGLDPGRARDLMRLLRRLADAGRQVVVATREPTDLASCDAVLVLARGAREAYLGPPAGLRQRFVSPEWADVFDDLAAVADARSDLLDGGPPAVEPPVRVPAAPAASVRDRAARRRIAHQAGIVARRRVRLIAADPPVLGLLALVPPLLVLLAATVADGTGLAVAGDGARRVLAVLTLGVAAASAVPVARAVAGDRAVYAHERAAGLPPEAYLPAEAAVFGGVAVLQAAATAVLWLAVRPGPAGAVLLVLPALELGVALAATALVSVLLGAAVAAFLPRPDRALPAVAAATAVQLPLCGALVPLAGEPLLGALAVFAPARWGFAALAATTGLGAGDPGDALWRHAAVPWAMSLLALAVQGALLAAAALWRLRR